VKQIRWDPIKNELLKAERGVSFDQLLEGRLILDMHHPSRPHQSLMLIEFEDYVWVVPYIESDYDIFLKTLYPSRKYSRLYLEGRLTDESELEEDQID